MKILSVLQEHLNLHLTQYLAYSRHPKPYFLIKLIVMVPQVCLGPALCYNVIVVDLFHCRFSCSHNVDRGGS